MPDLVRKSSILRYHRYDEDSYDNPKTRKCIRYYKQLCLAWPDWADDEKIKEYYKERDERRASGEDVVVDHSVPINHPYVSGLHNEFNLQVITALENGKKSDNFWPDMWAEQLTLEV